MILQLRDTIEMDENFSKRVKDVISFSKDEAFRLGNEYIGTEHLLLGLIREGEGTAIKIMDASTICDYRMVEFMKQTANANNIKWQPEILTAGGTDTAGIQRMTEGGSIAGAVSIPTRHLHQVIEMANKDDIQGSIDLLVSCVKAINKFDWKF